MTASFSGPLFDGTAGKLLTDGAEAAEQAIAEVLRDEVRTQARAQFRTRTGLYESRVRVEQARGDRVVTDSGLIYSDWLSGTAPRNRRSTFRGYRHIETADRQIDPRAGSIAEQALKPFIEKMG